MRLLWLYLMLLAPAIAAAQTPLTLADALARADRGAYANRLADASASASTGAATQSLQGLLPTVRTELGVVRTTDPLQAFGMLLRQRAVTPAAFDPAQLNNPLARTNVGAGLVAEVPLLNADAWYGRRAATRGADAAAASARWTRSGTAVDVARAYYDALLAQVQLATMDTALRAARGHVRDAESAVRNGLATRSDALLASVKAGEVEVQRAQAQANVQLARHGLALALGTPDDTNWTLPVQLPAAAAVRALAAAPAAIADAPREDVRAATLGAEAAALDAARARAALLPRLNGFGRLDWNAPSSLFAGQSAWTIGAQLTWVPFAGGRQLGDAASARSRRDAASTAREAATARATFEQTAAASAVDVGLLRLGITEQSVAQAIEAHRIVGRKYQGGLATVVEALDAAAVETQARLQHAAAIHALVVAVATHRRALGLDLDPLVALDPMNPGTPR